MLDAYSQLLLSTCPAKNQAGCIERVVHHSHENQKFYLFKIAINEKCQKPKLTVKVIMVAMATAVSIFFSIMNFIFEIMKIGKSTLLLYQTTYTICDHYLTILLGRSQSLLSI